MEMNREFVNTKAQLEEEQHATAPMVEEEEDEFVVIRDADDDNAVGGPEEDGNSTPIQYIETSQPVSECGTMADVADVGEGLDVGTQKLPILNSNGSIMNSSTVSTASVGTGAKQQQFPFMDTSSASFMSFYPFSDNTQAEKLIEGQEKAGAKLEQIMQIVKELSGERVNNSELRNKVVEQEEEVANSKTKIEELELTLAKFKNRVNADAEHRNLLIDTIAALEREKEERNGEFAQLLMELTQLRVEKESLKGAYEIVADELNREKQEVENQREVINVLQEQHGESERFFEESRRVYRERLNKLEEQVASYYARNEVNFPGGSCS